MRFHIPQRSRKMPETQTPPIQCKHNRARESVLKFGNHTPQRTLQNSVFGLGHWLDLCGKDRITGDKTVPIQNEIPQTKRSFGCCYRTNFMLRNGRCLVFNCDHHYFIHDRTSIRDKCWAAICAWVVLLWWWQLSGKVYLRWVKIQRTKQWSRVDTDVCIVVVWLRSVSIVRSLAIEQFSIYKCPIITSYAFKYHEMQWWCVEEIL